MSAVELEALGTTARLVVDDRAALAPGRAQMQAELAELERAASRFRPDSELRRAEAAGGAPTVVSPLLAEAITAALWAARATGGAVDPTVGAALCAAGYDRDFAAVAAVAAVGEDAPDDAMPAPVPGWRRISFNARRRVLRVPTGVRVDLGATAKALAADRIARAVHARTGASVLVSLGGDVALAGARRWPVGIVDDRAAATVAVGPGGLATSSTAMRRWRRGGEQRHHIIDPATGRPARTPWRTVSVAASSCLAANTASTAAIVLGPAAPAWLAARGLPARLVGHDGRVLRVAGWPVGDA